MAAQPINTKIQDLVYNVDSGFGLRLVKVVLYILFIAFVVLLFTANQFRGLREAEAMEYAQLGRNWMAHRQYVTQNVRPASIGYLVRKTGVRNPPVHGHPDLIHAPLYPTLLGVWFRVTGARFDGAPQGPLQIYQPEYRIMLLNHLFAILTGVLLFVAAGRLFDGRIALLGTTVYFLSDLVWRESLAGTGVTIAAFWAMGAFYAMILAVARIEEEPERSRRWILPALAAAACCVLAFLTRYSAAVLVPGLALWLGWSLGRRRWMWSLVFVGVFLVGISPWLVRNIMICGSPLGLAPYMALTDSSLFIDNAFERTLHPELGGLFRALQIKLLENLGNLYQISMRTIGEGLLVAIFLTTFLYRFVRRPIHTLRWGLALSILLLLPVGALYGEGTFRVVLMFWPLIILYGLSFFFLLLERLQLQLRFLNLSVTGLVIFLSAIPLILTLMPPRARPPYPPYAPGLISYVSNLLEPHEVMCTDMPWATAWYGGRTSVLLPYNLDQFYEINDYMQRFSGMYLTHVTRDLPYARILRRAPAYSSWFPIQEGRLPRDFPLSQGIPLLEMEQLFLSDRPRWQE